MTRQKKVAGCSSIQTTQPVNKQAPLKKTSLRKLLNKLITIILIECAVC